MENGGAQRNISEDDVISKLKDDGDFDRLRLKIIRKLKEDEELRNSIISMVKESAALNGPEADHMRPRQLSDAIHQEVGDKVMSQISDNLWGIIRSDDGMRTEITETVQSVYSRLLNPRGYEEAGSSSLNAVTPVEKQAENAISITASPHETDDISRGEPTEPPGFSLPDHHHNNHVEQPEEELQLPTPHDNMPREEQSKEPHHSEDATNPDNEDSNPPGFSAVVEPEQLCDGSDEDPDLPPGFG